MGGGCIHGYSFASQNKLVKVVKCCSSTLPSVQNEGCSDDGLTLETSAIHQLTSNAKNISDQPLVDTNPYLAYSPKQKKNSFFQTSL